MVSNKISGTGGGVSAGIFLDPRAVTVFDAEHSDYDDRWVTMGIGQEGTLLVVVHTFERIDEQNRRIRIISARKATQKETQQYREENP